MVRSILRAFGPQEIGALHAQLGARREGVRALRHRTAALLAGDQRWSKPELLREIDEETRLLMESGRYEIAFRLLEGACELDRENAPILRAAQCAIALARPAMLHRIASHIDAAKPGVIRDACRALVAAEEGDVGTACARLAGEGHAFTADTDSSDAVLVFGYVFRELGWRSLLSGASVDDLPFRRLEGILARALAGTGLSEHDRAAMVAEAMMAQALRNLIGLQLRDPSIDPDRAQSDLRAIAAALETIPGAAEAADSVLALLGATLRTRGASAAAAELLRETCNRHRLPQPIAALAGTHLAALYFEACQWEDARACIRVARGEILGSVHDGSALFCSAISSAIPEIGGESEQLDRDHEYLRAIVREPAPPYVTAAANYALGWSALLRNDHAEAAERLWEIHTSGMWRSVGVRSAALLVRSAVRSGNAGGIRGVLETLRDSGYGCPVGVRDFATAHAQGMLAAVDGDLRGGVDQILEGIERLEVDHDSALGGELGAGHTLHRALAAIDVAEWVCAYPEQLSDWTDRAARTIAWAAHRLELCGATALSETARGLASKLQLGGHYLAQWAEQEQREAQSSRRADAFTALGKCTAREREVVLLLCRGWGNKEIAAELFVSVRTVEYHVRNVLAKLGLNSRVELRKLIRPAMPDSVEQLRTA